MESRGCKSITKKPTPFAQIAVLAQLTQIPFIITAIESLWNDVIDVHLAFCRATYLTAPIPKQYTLSDDAPLPG
jgi:hypothetical protein